MYIYLPLLLWKTIQLQNKTAKKGVLGSILVILILTILEFPAPIGFETRLQTNVSLFWLLLFVLIFVSEILAMFLVAKHPILGGRLGILAAILNIFQVIADQLHLMQPEVAPLGYVQNRARWYLMRATKIRVGAITDNLYWR